MIKKLEEVKEALQIAASYKYGDGGCTAMLNKALNKLNDIIGDLEAIEEGKELNVIYLQDQSFYEDGYPRERLWCEDDVFEKSTKYVRADYF